MFHCFTAQAFEYQIVSESFNHPSILQSYELGQNFKAAGFENLTNMNLASAGSPFNSVYITAQWDKALLLKAGLKAPSNMEGSIVAVDSENIQVFHFQYKKTPYVIVAYNLSKSEFKKIVSPWLKSSASSLWKILETTANAAECEIRPNKEILNSFSSTAQFINYKSTLQSIGRCGADAWGSVQGSMNDGIDFFKKLASNPQQLWSEMKESFLELKNFTLNINTELQELFTSLSSMTSEQKTQLACSIAGNLIAGAGLAFVSVAGMTRILPHLLARLKNIKKTLLKFAALEQLGIRIPNRQLIFDEVISCVK